MYERKYQKYSIKIKYLNGDTENISYQNYNENDYKDMLQLYNETKEHYKNDCVTINFIGITEDGKLEILFQKKIINEKELKIKEEADLIESFSSNELINQINELVNIIGKKQLRENEKCNILNKKQDLLLHQIEDLDKSKFTDKEKLELLDKLHLIRKQRREAKNNYAVLSYFTTNFDLGKFKKVTYETKTKVIQEEAKEKKITPLTPEIIEEKRIMKEIPYKNFKERINLIKQLQSKYDKVYYNDSKMVVTCYNKAK
jgi:hypothetical protein